MEYKLCYVAVYLNQGEFNLLKQSGFLQGMFISASVTDLRIGRILDHIFLFAMLVFLKVMKIQSDEARSLIRFFLYYN